MAYGSKFRSQGVLYFPGFPNGVKWLLISNAAIFIVWFFTQIARMDLPWEFLELRPVAVVKMLFIWQPVTYMFMHAGFGHIIWNMLALWMFGADIETAWGTRRFLQFYFFCGVGAGLCVILLNYVLPWGNPGVATVGASGAIFGILMAYAMMFPNRTILFSFLIPIQVKWFVLIIGTVTFMMSFQQSNGVSSFAHLGGLLFGYIFIRSVNKRKGVRIRVSGPSLTDRYHQWRLRRNRKKFQVYMKKHNDRGPWVN
ncbi:MAG TPA: rhomboid family intramembrane serine protease [Bryobacteraceae bacterium]|nr:rhomboid family intramembrane serine protease [Bryobacteraceae bacterium]